MKQKDMEIYFLKCSLAKTDQSLLNNLDLLMSKKLAEGWIPFNRLEKVSTMTKEAVEQKIGYRGAKNLSLSWEAREPPIVTDPAGGVRTMTKEFFCRDTLGDLRKKTVGLPIPSTPTLTPPPSNTPIPIT